MEQLKDLWHPERVNELFEQNFYSGNEEFAYSIRRAYCPIEGYFSIRNRMRRSLFACVRGNLRQEYPVVLEVLGEKSSQRRDPEEYDPFIHVTNFPLREHFNDYVAQPRDYDISRKTIERECHRERETIASIRFVLVFDS